MPFPKGKQENLLGEKAIKLRCLENKQTQSKLNLHQFPVVKEDLEFLVGTIHISVTTTYNLPGP